MPCWLNPAVGLGKFYKGRSQEKTPLQWLDIFLLRSPRNGAGSVLNFRAMCLLPAVSIASSQRSLTVPKPTKPNRGQVGDHSSIRDFSPIAVSGYPRGPRVGCETTCSRHALRLTYQLRLALEPKCLENPTATAREIPRDGADSIRDTQAVCDFRYWASKHPPLFHTIKTIVAIFLAKVSRAISGHLDGWSVFIRSCAYRLGFLFCLM
jgi:hypothetical protein